VNSGCNKGTGPQIETIPEEKQGGEDAVEAGADPTGEISVAENPAKSIPPGRNNLFSRIAIPFIMGILGMISGIFGVMGSGLDCLTIWKVSSSQGLTP
jgi:hypothetical protein